MWESGDQDWWESPRASGGLVENGRSGKKRMVGLQGKVELSKIRTTETAVVTETGHFLGVHPSTTQLFDQLYSLVRGLNGCLTVRRFLVQAAIVADGLERCPCHQNLIMTAENGRLNDFRH